VGKAGVLEKTSPGTVRHGPTRTVQTPGRTRSKGKDGKRSKRPRDGGESNGEDSEKTASQQAPRVKKPRRGKQNKKAGKFTRSGKKEEKQGER